MTLFGKEDIWYSQAMNMLEHPDALACKGANDVNYDEKDYDFTPEDLALIERGKEELIRRNIHRYTYIQVTLYVLDGRVSQDDADLYIDVFNADPIHFSPEWYDRVTGLNRLRERFNE